MEYIYKARAVAVYFRHCHHGWTQTDIPPSVSKSITSPLPVYSNDFSRRFCCCCFYLHDFVCCTRTTTKGSAYSSEQKKESANHRSMNLYRNLTHILVRLRLSSANATLSNALLHIHVVLDSESPRIIHCTVPRQGLYHKAETSSGWCRHSCGFA